jgi:hypothetical protein
MSNPVFDLIGKSYSDVKEEKVEVSSTNEVIIIENEEFDYREIDSGTAELLKQKEFEIKNIFSKAYTEIGRILCEAQEELSGKNQYDGVFYKWFTSLGFKKDKVYSLISRYKLLIGNSDKQILIENLPLSLSYEISKESCPEELKEKVFSGEIKTLKEFKEERNRVFSLEPNHAEMIISSKELEEEVLNVKTKYLQLERIYKTKFQELNNKEKNDIYNSLKSIENKMNKILKNIK